MAHDSKLRIIKGGAISSTDRASGTTWPLNAGSEAFTTYGSSSDLWGETWTPADVNASTFGVALSVLGETLGLHTGFVDSIRITVYYTEAPVGTFSDLVNGGLADCGLINGGLVG